MRRIVLLTLLLTAPQSAWAAGKEGLWTITTVWQFGMPIVPPAVAALVRQQRLKPPANGQPFTHYMCMTKSEADGKEALHLNNRDLDCVNRTVSQRAGRMVVESVCHGPLEGVGRAQILWRDSQHFEGSYDFKGRFRGKANRMTSQFSAEWSGSDCRGVRPFIAPTQ